MKGSISGNVLQTFLVQIPNYILGIAAGIFMTRQLGPEGKGVYTLFIANMQFLVMFMGMNLAGGLQYFVANGKISIPKLSAISVIMLAIIGLMGAGLLFLPLPFDKVFFADGYNALIYRAWLFASFFLSMLNAIVVGFLQGKKKFPQINLVSLANASINFSVFFIVYYLSTNGYIEAGIFEVLWLSLSIILLNTILYFVFFRIHVAEGIDWRFSKRKDLKPLFHFLIPSYISILINFFNYRFIIWIINYYNASEQLGYFSLALSFSQMALMATTAINVVMFPHFSSQQDSALAIRDFKMAYKINLYVIVLATLALLIASSWIIPWFYGDAFIPSIIPFNILAMGTLFLSQAQMFGHFFGAMNKNWLNSLVYAIVLLVLIVLSFIIVPKYGIHGGAWVNALSYFMLCCVFYFLFCRIFKVNFFTLFFINKEEVQKLKSFIGRGDRS